MRATGCADLFQSSANPERLTMINELGKTARIEELPPASLTMLGANLLAGGNPALAEATLRAGQRQYPSDVLLNDLLAECLVRLRRHEEAIRYFMAARSLRPEAAHQLAHALEAKGESEQAIVLLRRPGAAEAK